MNKPVRPMADPMIPLVQLQDAIDSGSYVVPSDALDDEGYMKLYDQQPSGQRYSYVKLVNNEAQALAILGEEDPINGIECFSVGYAVSEKHRGSNLSIEAVKKGLEDLKRILRQTTTIKHFYLEALVATTNIPSIKIAKKIFMNSGLKMIDAESGTESYFFHRLISIH